MPADDDRNPRFRRHPVLLQGVRWDFLTAEGEKALDGESRWRLHLHEGSWRLGCPQKFPDLSGLDIDHAEVLGHGIQSRGILRRRLTLFRSKGVRLSLREAWSSRRDAVSHASVLAFGRLVRTLHDRGIDCRSWSRAFSLHRGRICLRDPRQLILQSAPLGRKARLTSLARLGAEMWGAFSTFHQMRFLRGYGAEGNDLPDLRRHIFRILGRLWGRRARRAFGDNADFFRLRRGAFRIHGRNSTAAWTALIHLLPDPDRCWEGARIFKPGTRTHAGSLVLGGQTFFLKRFNDRGWWYRLRHLGRESRAIRTWRTGWHCHYAGIPAPLPLLCLEERRYGFLRRSYLLTSYIEHTAPLRKIWPGLSLREKRILLTRLGALAGRVHAAGWGHGDMKWDNFLVPASGGEPVLIDWDGSFRPPRGRKRKAFAKDIKRFLHDLARVGGTDGDRRTFLSGWRRWFAN